MSLFDENSAPSTDPTKAAPAASPAPSEVDQLLAGIKNEKGEQKYATVTEALKGLAHAQEFISTLKTEKEQLAATLKSQKQLEDLLARQPAATTQAPPAVSAPVPSVDDIVAVLEQRELQKTKAANSSRVKEALVGSFGADYKKVLSEKTAQLGLTPALVDEMAATSPDALLKLLEVKTVVDPSVKPSVASEALKPGEQKPKKKFDPFEKKESDIIAKWRASVKNTNARLGLD